MLIKQISVFVENHPGKLFEVTDILRKAKVDIRALTIADTTDFGILRLIVNDPEKAQKVLCDAKIAVSITNVIGVCLPDVPGGLCIVLGELNQSGVSVEYCYAFISHSKDDAHVILRVDDTDKAISTIDGMKHQGYSFLTAEEIYK